MLIAFIVVARIIGKDMYGKFGMIRSTVNMFAIFATSGLGVATTRYIALYKSTDKEKVSRVIGLSTISSVVVGLVVAGAMLLCSNQLAQSMGFPELGFYFFISSFVLLFIGMNGVQTGCITGFEMFKTLALCNLLSGILFLVMVIGLSQIYGFGGAVSGLLLGYLATWFINHIAVTRILSRNSISIDYKNSGQEFDSITHFVLPTVLCVFLPIPSLWLCNYMLMKYSGSEQMAIFDVANQWRILIAFVPVNLSKVALPMLSRLCNDKSGRYNRYLQINMLLNFIVSAGVALIVILFSGYILKLYGKGFEGGKVTLMILSFSAVICAVNDVLRGAFLSQGRMWEGLVFNVIWSIVIILVTYNLLQRGFGAVGVAIANIVSYIVIVVSQVIFLKFSGVKIND